MRRIAALVACDAGLAAMVAHAADALLPVESFFRLPEYAAMRISPDGKHIAALAPVRGRQNLVILDVTLKDAHPVSGFEDKDVVWFAWLSGKRLLLRTGTVATRDFDSRGGALFAVDADGSDSRQ